MIISIATGPWLPVPALQGGAIPRMWKGLAEEFAAQGHQVRILCRAYPGQAPVEMLNGVEYIRCGGFPQSSNITFDLFKDLVYALSTFPLLPQSDILVINDFWLPVFAALRPQVGKIVINANRFPKGQYRLYAKADLVTAASFAIEKAIAHECPSATNRMRVIPNPIDTKVFVPSLSKDRKGGKTILYVGRIHPEKGIHLLLDAFVLLSQEFSDIKLKIIGPAKEHQGGGGEDYLKRLKSKAEGLNVDFLEPIFNQSKLANAYREADLFCYPSIAEKGESFGVAPLEAMATGLAPVVSNLDCFKDFIEDEQTGFIFDHRNSDPSKNLANVLSEALKKWEMTSEISKNAIKQATKFSYEKIASLYLREFESLLKK